MAFDIPKTISHSLGIITLSAATTFSFRGPKGLKGRMIDIVGFYSTATTVTAPKLAVGNAINSPTTGTAADADSYCEFAMAIAAINTQFCASNDDTSWKSRTANTYRGKITANAVLLLLVTTTATAGAANTTFVIDWFQ
jgi:hypothetical protein